METHEPELHRLEVNFSNNRERIRPTTHETMQLFRAMFDLLGRFNELEKLELSMCPQQTRMPTKLLPLFLSSESGNRVDINGTPNVPELVVLVFGGLRHDRASDEDLFGTGAVRGQSVSSQWIFGVLRWRIHVQ